MAFPTIPVALHHFQRGCSFLLIISELVLSCDCIQMQWLNP